MGVGLLVFGLDQLGVGGVEMVGLGSTVWDPLAQMPVSDMLDTSANAPDLAVAAADRETAMPRQNLTLAATCMLLNDTNHITEASRPHRTRI